MAFWPVGDPSTFPPRENEGWGFDALDGFDFPPAEQGGNSDWDNWFAGLDALPENERRQRRHESSEAHASFDPHRHRSPSPAHGDYAPWLMGYELSSTRDAPSREAGGNNTTVAASSSSSRPANPPSHARHRQLPPPSTSAPAARHPAANHSNNWLDPLEARRPPRQPYIPDHFRPPPASDSASSVPSAYEGDSDYDNGIDIDDLLNTDVEDDTDMPPTTRRTQRSVVDLTNDPSSPPPASASTRKRARDDDAAGDGPSNKRPRRTSIEELDLTNENPSAEEELRQSQAAAAIAAQQSTAHPTTSSDRPLRVGQRTCIICMEPYTNATITSCGHIYCHECLTQALIAGEKSSERGVGNCPVCRKPVNRKKERQMVPVNFMKREAFKGKRALRGMRA